MVKSPVPTTQITVARNKANKESWKSDQQELFLAAKEMFSLARFGTVSKPPQMSAEQTP